PQGRRFEQLELPARGAREHGGLRAERVHAEQARGAAAHHHAPGPEPPLTAVGAGHGALARDRPERFGRRHHRPCLSPVARSRTSVLVASSTWGGNSPIVCRAAAPLSADEAAQASVTTVTCAPASAAASTVVSTQQSVDTPATSSCGAGPTIPASCGPHLPNVGSSTVGWAVSAAAPSTRAYSGSVAGTAATGQARKYSPQAVRRSAVGSHRLIRVRSGPIRAASSWMRGQLCAQKGEAQSESGAAKIRCGSTISSQVSPYGA